MINDLIEYFKNKKILILGFGREGKSTYKLIRKYLKDIELYIADKKESIKKDEIIKEDSNAKFITGEEYLKGLEAYDLIIKSPGISLAGIEIKKYEHKIKSQLELLLEFFDIFTIGITGTKGKSTTSSIIYQVLKDQNKDALLLGNIGVPAFDYIDNMKKDTILVLEMSSHQLEYMKKSPNIAILLNIYEEHLDHYNSFQEYINAKCNIYKYQNSKDYLLYNFDNKILKEQVQNINSIKYKVSMEDFLNSDLYLKDGEVLFKDKKLYDDKKQKRNLIGNHNLNNIMFGLAVSEILNLDLTKTLETISDFKPLPHRLELVGEFNGIFYYDNTIATIPEATIEAIKTIKNVDTLIIGGMDRGINYEEFIKYINSSNVNNIICMPKTGHDIAKKLTKENVYIVELLEEAVKIAKEVTKKGKSCLLSPAAASYGFFKNFEEKGDIYQTLVKM